MSDKKRLMEIAKNELKSEWGKIEIDAIKTALNKIQYHQDKVAYYLDILKRYEETGDETILVYADKDGALKYKYV